MKHGEKIAPVAAAMTGLGTLVCCVPVGFAAAAVSASLSAVVARFQPWFLGASVLLLLVGVAQLRQTQRTCATRQYSSLVVLSVSTAIVLLVIFFPQVIAGMMADWLP